MSLKQLEPTKLLLYSSSSRQRNSTISPNLENNKRIEDYLLLSTIGRGTFSKVKLALHLPTKQKVAIKILDQEKIVDETDIERIKREIHILSLLHHKNIVHLYETITCNNNIYIVMEYIEGKDLFQYIYSLQRLTEYKSSQLFRQLISCLEYIHKLGIVHRDIKPENILLDKERKKLKLVDFGLGNIYKKNELVKTACGSPCYAAPEMLSGKPYDGFYSDLWSCGVVLYCMLVGSLPFDDEDIKILYHNIKIANYVMPNFLSNYAQDLIRRILVTNPKRRITLEEIKSHPFLLMSEKINIYKELDDGSSIILDYDIIQKMKTKFFKEEENINFDFIIQNIKNNLHNKITTIYYLMCKEKQEQNKNIEKNKNKNEINNEKIKDYLTIKNKVSLNEAENSESEKSPSFIKFVEKIDKKILVDDDLLKENSFKDIKSIKNIENQSKGKNNKKIKIHNIKKILFNNSKKISNKNTITRNETNSIKNNNQRENITFNNDNNEKNFNILVINNFMQEKEISKMNTVKPNLNHNKKLYNFTENKIDRKQKNKHNYTPKINIRNINRYEAENIKNHHIENNSINSNNSKYNYIKNMIINRIVNSINKSNLKKVKKLNSVNYYQKMRIKTSPNNMKNNQVNLSLSINNTINNNAKNKKYSKGIFYNTNKSKNNNKINYYNNIKENNKIISINTHNITPFQKCKKLDLESLDLKLNEQNMNNIHSNTNEIKNDNMTRQNYILSKLTMGKERKSNKSINFGNNQGIGNNKFKKYMNRLLDNENSFNKENVKNKTMNLTPILNHININHLLKNKNEKIISSKNKVNNRNLFPIKFDCNLIKKNKITNLFEYYRINGLKHNIQRNNNVINNLNKKPNNINQINRYDLEEKLSEYMKKRFKNYIRKTSTNPYYNNNKSHNLYNLNLNNKSYLTNNNASIEKNSISPNSIANKGKNKLYLNLNKSYFKNHNARIIYNKKSKNSNNSSKNNSINHNRNKNRNKKNTNNNFLLTTNFSNIIKKNISNKNRNNKNRNNENLVAYNSIIINNKLKNTYKLNFSKSINNSSKNGYKATYHSRDKSKNNSNAIQYTQTHENSNKNNFMNYNNIINTDFNEFNNNINNNSKLMNNFSKYYFDGQNYRNNGFGINNINLI